MPEPREAEAANRMYWESDDSVASIAARFDLSRRSLYEAVQPLPTGVLCQVCGEELAFENRLARKSGTATCPSCGASEEVAIETEAPAMAAAARRGESRDGDATPDDSRDDAGTTDVRQRAVLLSGAALAGIALGGVATWLARRRD